MSFLIAAIYDRFMQAGEEACVGAWRKELLSEARGHVLEVGAGTGLNLKYYPSTVSHLVLCEPDAHMRRKLEDKTRDVESDFPIRIETFQAEQLPHPDASFDTVVSTLVLCSVREPTRALQEIRRVLRPNGTFLFLEHVADDDPQCLAWQRRIEPFWKRMAGNCHLQRRTCLSMQEVGFTFDWLERDKMRRALPFVRSTIRGSASIAREGVSRFG